MITRKYPIENEDIYRVTCEGMTYDLTESMCRRLARTYQANRMQIESEIEQYGQRVTSFILPPMPVVEVIQDGKVISMENLDVYFDC